MTHALPEDLNPEGRYTAAQTAGILGVNISTLWRWAKTGKIAVSGYFKVNGRPYYKGKEIARTFNRCY